MILLFQENLDLCRSATTVGVTSGSSGSEMAAQRNTRRCRSRSRSKTRARVTLQQLRENSEQLDVPLIAALCSEMSLSLPKSQQISNSSATKTPTAISAPTGQSHSLSTKTGSLSDHFSGGVDETATLPSRASLINQTKCISPAVALSQISALSQSAAAIGSPATAIILQQEVPTSGSSTLVDKEVAFALNPKYPITGIYTTNQIPAVHNKPKAGNTSNGVHQHPKTAHHSKSAQHSKPPQHPHSFKDSQQLHGARKVHTTKTNKESNKHKTLDLLN